MINLLIDEGYYVDFLSILEVKLLKSDDKTRDSLSKQFLFYSNSLGEQIGDSKLEEILDSVLYKKLKDVNQILFETIDNCKKYQIDARTIDAMNHTRWILKNEIQRTFFGKSTGEVKIGY